MKAIVIAASKGRDSDRTRQIGPCMVEVGGRPMLHHQIEAFEKNGITDVVVIRGYKRGTAWPRCSIYGQHRVCDQ